MENIGVQLESLGSVFPELGQNFTIGRSPINQWRTQEKISGVRGNGSGLVGGPGAEPPGRRRILENLQKIPEENCKNAVFSRILQKNFKTMR